MLARHRWSATWLGLLAHGLAALSASGARADADACLSAHEHVQVAWHAGRLSEALEASVGCAQQACTQLVRGDCVRWNSELARSLPSLVLAVRDDSGNDLANARTFANGLLLAARSDGRPVPLNPGAYRLRFEAPGFASAEQDLVVRIGEQLRRVEVQLVRIVLTPRAEPAHRNDAAARAGPRVAQVSPASLAAIALAGSAAASGLVGAGFGIRGLRSEHHCETACSPAQANRLRRDLRIGDVLGAAAATLGVGALVTYLLGRRHGNGAAPISAGFSLLPRAATVSVYAAY